MCRYTVQLISFWNYGEPLLNPDLSAMIRLAASYGIKTQVSTNGSLLSARRLHDLLTSGLDRLIVSIDTPDADVYSRYRIGGSYGKLIANVEEAVRRRNDLHSRTAIVAQYMIMNDNENTSRMLNHAKALGVDYAMIKTLGIGSAVDRPTTAEWSFMPTNEHYHRYISRDDLRSKIIPADTARRCCVPWEMMVMNADGICVPCCRDQTTQFPLGSVVEVGSLMRIWNSRGYRNYRRRILETQRSARMCIRCGDMVRESIDPGLFRIT